MKNTNSYFVLLLGLIVFGLQSCFKDDFYDPEKQLEKDVKTIQKHLQERNITDFIYHNKGLFVVVKEPGSGKIPTAGNRLRVDYKGYLLDGRVFDTSIEQEARNAGIYNPQRNYSPFEFTYLANPKQVIDAWDIGFQYLKENGKATFYVPSPLGYGQYPPQGSIIPNRGILVFDVHLISVNP
jgi:FKBP-type peptidyl-prolyl cis-trans isomerase FkpA